jgi:hypothetical protein
MISGMLHCHGAAGDEGPVRCEYSARGWLHDERMKELIIVCGRCCVGRCVGFELGGFKHRQRESQRGARRGLGIDWSSKVCIVGPLPSDAQKLRPAWGPYLKAGGSGDVPMKA